MSTIEVSVTVNGSSHTGTVEPRKTLADFLQDDLGLMGTHLGCEHGVCGACTVILDDVPFGHACISRCRSTVRPSRRSRDCDRRRFASVRPAFRDAHGLQCGFCTPGFVVSSRSCRVQPASHRGGDPPRTLRQPMPLHRVSGNPSRCAQRGERDEGLTMTTTAIPAAGPAASPAA